MKRADYVLTHYSFRPADLLLTAAIGLAFAALLVLRFGFGYFELERSWFIAWLKTALD